MRLTLRTLLAYLDDILDPVQTKEIGKKIQESTVASSLVSRIREVMRRRRLTAPTLTGAGADVDPNAVAEYLDNTLPPEGVADIERICLESDVHLAEVAASHQILTLVLGEPVEIVPHSRERMYALLPAGKPKVAPSKPGNTHAATAAASVVSAAPEPAPMPAQNHSQPRSFEESIPDYLKPQPVWKRLLPYVAVMLLVGVWVGLLYYDPSILPGFGPQQPAVQVAVAPTVPEEDDLIAEPDLAPESLEVPEQAPEPDFGPEEGARPFSLDPEPPEDETEPTVARVPKEAPPVKPILPDNPEPVASTRPRSPAVARVPTTPNVPSEEPPEVPTATTVRESDVPFQYSSPEGVLLRYDSEADAGWYRMPSRAMVHPRDLLVVPEPQAATFVVGSERNQLVLLSGSRVEILGTTPAAPTGIDLRQGRVILRPGSLSEDQTGAVFTLAVKIHGKLHRLELLTPDTVCGMQVVPRQPEALEEDFGNVTYSGVLYVVSGSARLANDAGQVKVLNGPDWLTLTPQKEEDAASEGVAEIPLPENPDVTLPAWLTQGDPPNSFAKLFDKMFEFDEPAGISLVNAAKDRRPEISRLAVSCQALIQNLDGMLYALERGEHEEARLAAINGLRTWIADQPENRELLKRKLQIKFHPDSADAIYRLVWGFGIQDAQDKETSQQLIEWLANDELPIRELAFYYVLRLTGRRYDYRPNSPVPQRNAAIQLWQHHLDKDGALLPSIKSGARFERRFR